MKRNYQCYVTCNAINLNQRGKFIWLEGDAKVRKVRDILITNDNKVIMSWNTA